MNEEVKIVTKMNPEVLKVILNDIVLAVGHKCTLMNEYHFGDGVLKLAVSWEGGSNEKCE